MAKLFNNTLLLASFAAMAFYWTVGYVVGQPYLSVAVSSFLMLSSASTLGRYAMPAYGVLFRGERNEDDNGHWALYGIFLLSLGAFYGGAFNLTWVLAGEPASWLGTPQSNFGRALMAGGFALLFRSPDDVRKRFFVPSTIWLVSIMIAAVIAAFFLGTQFAPAASTSPAVHWPVAPRAMASLERPACPDDRPIWVASNSEVFHGPASPYRALVVPSRCFASEAEAAAAGYRAPGH